MSADGAWDVQTGVYARLAGNDDLAALLATGAGSVLDHVPPGTAFPYVVIGESSVRPLDSQRSSGSDVTLAIHSYSRGSGMQQLKQVMSAVYAALHDAAFSVPNRTLVLCQCLGADTALDGDGLTRHGVQHFRIITEPA